MIKTLNSKLETLNKFQITNFKLKNRMFEV